MTKKTLQNSVKISDKQTQYEKEQITYLQLDLGISQIARLFAETRKIRKDRKAADLLVQSAEGVWRDQR